MKRILISLVAAAFALAAGASFAQAPAQPAKSSHTASKSKTTKHASHKSGKKHAAAKKSVKAPVAS